MECVDVMGKDPDVGRVEGGEWWVCVANGVGSGVWCVGVG